MTATPQITHPPAQRPDGAPWPITDAAEYLAVSDRHIRRLIDYGQVRAIRIGRRVLIPSDEIARLAREGVRQ
jgi:excisionase family DNA binding protein